MQPISPPLTGTAGQAGSGTRALQAAVGTALTPAPLPQAGEGSKEKISHSKD